MASDGSARHCVPFEWRVVSEVLLLVAAVAMLLFGQTSAALRALDLIAVPITAAALYFVGARVANRRVGLWAALFITLPLMVLPFRGEQILLVLG